MKEPALLTILAFSMAVAGCSRQSKPQETVPVSRDASRDEFVLPSNAQGIVTATEQPQPISEYLTIPAHIEPDPARVVRVYSPVGGRLIALRVLPGDRVHGGQTIAVLESSDVSAALSAYRKAMTALQLAQQALQRASDLYQHGATALKDFQQAQADFSMAQADAENARRQLQVLNVNPNTDSDQIPVTAPRSGIVLRISAAAGEYSKSLDSSDPLCVLADLRTVWAVGDLLEKDFSSVKVGAPADLTLVAFPGETWKGRVSLISSTVDPVTRTLKLRVVLPNEADKLRPDMFGTLRLVRAKSTGIVVPNTAVLREGTAAFVFVERPDGHFVRRAVTLGGEVEGNKVQVIKGLDSGNVVVVEGTDLLRSATGAP